MRYISLLLISLFALVYAAEAETSVSQAIAVKVASIMKKNEDVVKVANEASLKDLRKLLLANKKDKNASVLIALKINKLDKTDKDAIEWIKDIPPESQDLLGAQADPNRYINEVKAKLIVDALAKDKLTEKDWDSLPGIAINISVNRDKNIQINGYKKILIVPCPNDKWRRSTDWPFIDWRGSKDGEMKLAIYVTKIDGLGSDPQMIPYVGIPIEIKDGFTGNLRPNTGGTIAITGSGFIRVKIYEVVPLE